ncbi:MAG: iron transporter [Aeromicrobium sp.]|nr:iron transporter [Burkholderiales bacterium]
MNIATRIIATLACGLIAPVSLAAEPKVKLLSPAQDTAKGAVLIGRTLVDKMSITLEIEGGESMWMQMGKPPMWMEKKPAKGDLFHVEVKPVDPVSKTRIPYAEITFSAINNSNKKKVMGTLHPSWGGSGLHYAWNTPLAGDGVYDATVTVGAPTFSRTEKNKDFWTKPVVTKFHFKVAGTTIVEVSEPLPELQ